MKNLAILSVLIPLLCLFSCKKEVQDPYPCPSENENKSNYLCASVNGNKFISVGKKDILQPYTRAFVGDFLSYPDGNPRSVWYFLANNYKTNESISIALRYPFKFGEKITSCNFSSVEGSKPNAFSVSYFNGSKYYNSDSLSIGFIIINGDLNTTWKSAKFEVDVANEHNSTDRIRITNGRFYLADSLNDLYTQ